MPGSKDMDTRISLDIWLNCFLKGSAGLPLGLEMPGWDCCLKQALSTYCILFEIFLSLNHTNLFSRHQTPRLHLYLLSGFIIFKSSWGLSWPHCCHVHEMMITLQGWEGMRVCLFSLCREMSLLPWAMWGQGDPRLAFGSLETLCGFKTIVMWLSICPFTFPRATSGTLDQMMSSNQLVMCGSDVYHLDEAF